MISKLLDFANHRGRRRGHYARRNSTCRPVLEYLEDRCVPAGIDPILEWNAVALQANAVTHTLPDGTQTGPTLSARALAIVHVAMFDALNSIKPHFTPYVTMVPDAQGASVDAAVGQAAHDTLVALYPAQKADFDAALERTLERVDGQPEGRGIVVGEAVAQAILAARANDGSDVNVPYVPVPGLGVHDVDPYHPTQEFYGPGHGSITPFVITSSTQFPVAPPPALNSPAYTAAYNEVKDLGGDGKTTPTLRTPEQTQIGIYWGYDGSPGLGTPPRLYNQIARTIAEQRHNTEAENARLFALVNVAMADAGIAAWQAKYDYDFWRPVLGIQQGEDDGNPLTKGDPDWKYYGAPRSNDPGGTNFTPNFPAYTSGHATFGAAAFRSLADFYGRDDIHFSFMSDEFNGQTRDQDGTVRPVVTRSFASFSQAAEENGQSRIYLGIHWVFDKTEGIKQGNAVADYVFANYFRPLHGSDGMDQAGSGASLTSTDVVPAQADVSTLNGALSFGSVPIAVVEVAAALPFSSAGQPRNLAPEGHALGQPTTENGAANLETDDAGHQLGRDNDDAVTAETLDRGIGQMPSDEVSAAYDAVFEWLAREWKAPS